MIVKFAAYTSLVALILLSTGCASGGAGSGGIPDDPLNNGYAKISLCSPSDEVRAESSIEFECGKALSIAQVDGDTGGFRISKRKYVYVLPGEHTILVTNVKKTDYWFKINVVAGKYYRLEPTGRRAIEY